MTPPFPHSRITGDRLPDRFGPVAGHDRWPGANVSRQVLWKARRGTDVTWPVAKAIADVLDCRPGDVCATFADDRVAG
mgnify:CR=1 FL=1